MSKLQIKIGFCDRADDAREFNEQIMAGLSAAVAGQKVEPLRTITFENYATYHRIMTPNRVAILDYVVEHNGVRSVRALSQALSRDYAAVHSDVDILVKEHLLERDGNAVRFDWESSLQEA